MPDLTPERLAEIEERLAKATPYSCDGHSVLLEGQLAISTKTNRDARRMAEHLNALWEFANEDIPDLIAALRAAWAERDAAVTAIAELEWSIGPLLDHADGTRKYTCPGCGMFKGARHQKTCPIGKALGKVPGAIELSETLAKLPTDAMGRLVVPYMDTVWTFRDSYGNVREDRPAAELCVELDDVNERFVGAGFVAGKRTDITSFVQFPLSECYLVKEEAEEAADAAAKGGADA